MLQDEQVLSESVFEDGMMYVMADLDGGKKKKKKKNYTTKKKNKHKHKNTKLALLKYYTIDAKGVITFARKVCPECGPGFFMAKHFDRHYCGRCHASLKLDPETIKKNLIEREKRLAAKKKDEAEAALGGAAGGKDAKKGGKDKKKGKK